MFVIKSEGDHVMSFSNPVNKMVSTIYKFPLSMRSWMLSTAVGKIVKMVGASKVKIHEMTYEKSVLTLANHKKVQNHIGGIHACGMALLAESATGLVVGMNVPKSSVNVLKTMKIDYTKRAQGALKAVATLTQEQIDSIRNTEKGEVIVNVEITDEAGNEPINCQITWAWVPKIRKKAA